LPQTPKTLKTFPFYGGDLMDMETAVFQEKNEFQRGPERVIELDFPHESARTS